MSSTVTIYPKCPVSSGPSDGSPDAMPSNTHWRGLPVLNERFWNFLRSVTPLTKTGKVVRFFENFFSHYLLEGNGLFGQKDLKLFLSSTPLDSSGRFERKIFIFSSFSTHWTKIAVWSKKSETFFFHYPTDMRCRSGPLFRKLFSPNTQRTHGAVLNERK